MPSPDTFWSHKQAGLRYGFAWCGLGFMRLLVLLPLRWQLRLGKGLGRLARPLARNRTEIARRNLTACFPSAPPEQIERLLGDHFASLGASFVEMAMGWYGAIDEMRALTEIQGIEHLEHAQAQGRGVVLYSAHLTSFEFFFPTLAMYCGRLSGMYKEQRNPVMNRAMNAGRGRSVDRLVSKDNVRDMIRELKRNAVFWYASDQTYWGKNAALIPFFGVPAMTNTAISRIARKTGAVVLPYFCKRVEPGPRYVATIGPPLDAFPTDDPAADTARLVARLEHFLRSCPEQYWWIHQRFKNRPAPLPDFYAAKHAR